MLGSAASGELPSMSLSCQGLGALIDQLALHWIALQSNASAAQNRAFIPPDADGVYFLHPISFVKYVIAQLNDGTKASLRKLLMESYRYQRVPTQHVNDYCFGRSLKYLCMDGKYHVSDAREPQAGNVAVFASQGAYTKIHWAICGSEGRLYHVDSDCENVICSKLGPSQRLIHVIELNNMKLSVNPESVFSYYTSPYVRAELNEAAEIRDELE